MKVSKLIFQLLVLLIIPIKNAYSQNNALNFDGTDDYVEVAGITNPSLSFTVEAWARMETKGWRTVLSKIENGFFGYTISYDFNNDKMGAGLGTGSSWIGVQSLTSWNLNQWYHVALVYDADVSTLYYYQDGILQGSTFGTPSFTSSTFKIGDDAWMELWDGDIDEVRLWNYARTQTEIQSTMNSELLGSETGLLNYYNFNQGVPGGNNTAITSLTDFLFVAHGTFMNFALNGSTSNFVGSLTLDINSLQESNLNIYPNPLSDQLMITNKQNSDIINFEIINIQGQIIYIDNLIDRKIINTANWPSGIYFLNLKADKKIVVKKIVKD